MKSPTGGKHEGQQFFYVCAGILILTVSYQLGATRVGAQGMGDFTGICVTPESVTVAIRNNGDVYARPSRPACTGPGITWCCGGGSCEDQWSYMGNVLTGTVNVEGTSIPDVKKKFREEE